MPDNVYQVRTPIVNFYIHRDSDGLYLIDCGFIGGIVYLQKALYDKGWQNLPILGIIVTHGHLDHILNVKEVADESGAWIAAPSQDINHYLGALRSSILRGC